MAIDGLIILESHGRPVIQTSFKSTSPTYPLLHIDALTKAVTASPNGQPDPVLYVPTDQGASACFHMEVGPGLRMLCPVTGDIQPLYVFSFMQLFSETLRDYLGEITSATLREHFDIVYQLLEEMLDNGYPLTTERSALRDIVIPPSLLNSIISKTGISGLSKASANPFNSPIPWRKAGVKHSSNEILFDISEDMRAIVDKSGNTLSSQVFGKIESNSRLSGVPDLALTFADTKNVHDVAFHQCVRLQRWLRDKTLSFVPPDGHFVLMEYSYAPVPTSVAVSARPVPVPFSFTHSVDVESNGGTLNFHLTSKLTTRSMDRIMVELRLGEGATGANCTVTSGSKWLFDPKSLRLRWEIVNISQGSSHHLRGSFTSSKPKPRPSQAFQMSFETSMYTFSGLKIDQLRLTNEAYKPYKGVKGRSRGEIEWRR